MPNLKQPVAGFVASAVMIALSFGFISLFTFPTFAGWVSYYLVCIVPIQVIIGVVWGGKYPATAAELPQPAKGITLTLLALAVALIQAAIFFYTVGGRISPPTPILEHFAIVTVVTTFWIVFMFNAWPFTTVSKNPAVIGFSLLVGIWVIAYGLFRAFFNYAFFKGAPFYVDKLDPKGLFMGPAALSFFLSVMFGLFLMLNFDLWPLSKSPGLMKQPVLGVAMTVVTVAIGAVASYVARGLLHVDPTVMLAQFSVAFVFGVIVVVIMCQGSLFATLKQPIKGILSTIASAVIGFGLSAFYGLVHPFLSGKLASGPPTYDYQVWLASALLAVTFPFLSFCGFFDLWPFIRPHAAPSTPAVPTAVATAARP
jgi:hypothetical protein